MKLHTLLSHIDEAETAGDIGADSPVFAVVRNAAAALDSPEAWHAISIVDVKEDPGDGAVDFVADDSEDAADMSISALRGRVAALPATALEYEVLVRVVSGDDSIAGSALVVDAYGDEQGLGLMLWFEGYDDWFKSQG